MLTAAAKTQGQRFLGKRVHFAYLVVLALAITSLMFVSAPSAFASKQVVDFFGGNGTLGGEFAADSPAGIAVNYTGAGGVPSGTIYVSDGNSMPFPEQRGNRIQRFQRDDNGTLSDTTDDTYSFVSAWGAGVDGGGTDYEICTVAPDCAYGAAIGGNGTMAGNGSLNGPAGIAVDQDTGEVYVLDGGPRQAADNNARINVYSSNGAFLRSFGWDVVATGPNDNGVGYEVCKAGIDVCKAGLAGSGVGQIGVPASGEYAPLSIAVSQPDGNPAGGTVFVADRFNRRINTYGLDGSSPDSIGSAAIFINERNPSHLAVDSRGILYATNQDEGFGTNAPARIERYDTEDANGGGAGFMAPIEAAVDELQRIAIKATVGQFRLSFGGDTTADLDFDASREEVREALEALPSIGASNVFVSGGPGDGSGSSPYVVLFKEALGSQDVEPLILAAGTTPLSGGAGPSSVTTVRPGQYRPLRGPLSSLSIDPDTDGPGPDADTLFVGGSDSPYKIQQYGPLNAPGFATPPSAFDDAHGGAYQHSIPRSLAVEPPTGRLYAAAFEALGSGIFVLDEEGPPPTVTLDSLSGITARSVVAHATIDPNGPPNTSYRFEYSTDETNWIKGPTTILGHQSDPQILEETVGLGAGLHPGTHYYVRLVAGRSFGAPIVTSALDFTTSSAPPIVETTGSPLRTTTSAQLSGRVVPGNEATEYHFEYGDQGPCSASPCQATEPHSADSGDEVKFVAEQIEGLAPGTTYHYRLIADNGNPSGPAHGGDMTITTRASEAPLSHGRFPGPAGSDRAYEQVSLADSGGNPVVQAYTVSDAGDRVFYQVSGGTPLSAAGSTYSSLFAERVETASHQGGWRSTNLYPPREALVGSSWVAPGGARDLSDQVIQNFDTTTGRVAIWRLRPGQPAAKLFEPSIAAFRGPVMVSEDASRVLTFLRGAEDPSHIPPNDNPNLYDISSGAPRLVGLLPGGLVPACGAGLNVAGGGAGAANIPRSPHWVSADGSLVFFQACNDLYLRDLVGEETTLIAPNASLVKSMPGAAFISTGQSFETGDAGGEDVYRYDLEGETFDCVTCVVSGLSANVITTHGLAIAEDGSRVYFKSPTALVPGAGTPGLYRVDVSSGELAYVAPAALMEAVSDNPNLGNAITPNGSAFVFASKNSDLNALGGQQNGGTLQYYRYDDRDRSLTCLSCRQDGSAPTASVLREMAGPGATNDQAGANKTPLSADGNIVAFATTNALLSADQNSARPGQIARVGTDIYEWRDGRLFLITDGLTDWPDGGPQVSAVAPSGKDIFFTAAAQLTQDALDGFRRLYTARIDGGFEFPPPPRPCPLEVCQGTPKGAPEEQEPGSGNFAGSGNKTSTPLNRRSCLKGRHKARKGGKARCVKSQKGKAQQKKRQRAKHDRRNAR